MSGRHSWVRLFLAVLSFGTGLWATDARALRSDEVNEVLVVCSPNGQKPAACDLTVGNYGPDGNALNDRLQRLVGFLDETLGQNVHYYNVFDLNNRLRNGFNITDYDFVVWYNERFNVDKTWPIVQEITKYEMPTALFEMNSAGFPASQALQLIPERNYGYGNVDYDPELWTAAVEGFANEWHYMNTGTLMLRRSYYDSKNWSYELPPSSERWQGRYDMPVSLGGQTGMFGNYAKVSESYYVPFSAEDNKIIIENSGKSTSYYTRPVLGETRSVTNQKAYALANDHRQIVVFGFIPDNGGDEITTHHPGWSYIHRGFSFILMRSTSKSDTGALRFEETDLTVPSRGFDFELKRTYNSNQFNETSLLGPAWTLNHDRYIVWDKYNDRIIVQNGDGKSIQMEMVQGEPIANPLEIPTKQRTFASVNQPNTDIATYYPPSNNAPLTRPNPAIPTDDKGISSNGCTGQRHETHPSENTNFSIHRAGFTIRDKNGNIAFFEHQPFVDKAWATSRNGALGKYKGGELEYYRISYLEDANGNRQNYYYSEVESDEFTIYGPTADYVLNCIVDTEGRGYYFENEATKANVPPYQKNDINTVGHHIIKVIPPSWINEEIPTVHYNFSLLWDSKSPSDSSVSWNTSQGARLKKYTYHDFNNPVLMSTSLKEIYETVHDTSRKLKSFSFETGINDNFARAPFATLQHGMRLVNMEYPGRLLEETTYSDDSTVAKRTQYHYYNEKGRGDLFDLAKVQGVVTEVTSGRATSIGFNSRNHAVKKMQWHISPAPYASYSTDGAPSRCSFDLTNENLNPMTKCQGAVTRIYTNFDGQPVLATSPSGLTTMHSHLVDAIFTARNVAAGPVPADYNMLLFWKDYWHLRPYLANEYSTAKKSADGSLKTMTNTAFEPVFNQPIETFEASNSSDATRHVHSYRYDYMTDPSYKIYSRLLGLMKLPQAAANSRWPSELPRALDAFAIIPWVTGSDEWDLCTIQNASGSVDTLAGNMICEILPETSDVDDSTGLPRGSIAYAYDGDGQPVAVRNALGGTERISRYIDSKGRHTITNTVDTGSDSSANKKTVTKTDGRGLVVSKERFADSNLSYKQLIDRDAFGLETRVRVFDGTGVVSEDKMTYDIWGRLLAKTKVAHGEVENAAGAERGEFFSYDGAGQLIAECHELEENGNGTEDYSCTRYDYENGLKRYIWQYDTCTFAADSLDEGNANLASLVQRSPQVRRTRHYYDWRFQPYKTYQYAPGEAYRWTQTRYDMEGRTVQETSPEGLVSTKTYDDLSRLARTVVGTGADAVATSFVYDAFNRPVTQTSGAPSGVYGDDATLGKTETVYDERSQAVKTTAWQYEVGTAPSDDKTTTSYVTYNQGGQIVRATSDFSTWGYEAVTYNTFDGAGQLVATYDGSNMQGAEYTLDGLGRTVYKRVVDLDYSAAVVDTASEFAYQYDAQDRVTQEAQLDALQIQPDRVTTYRYDAFGHLGATIDPKGQMTSYLRNGQGLPKVVYEHHVPGGYNGSDGSQVNLGYRPGMSEKIMISNEVQYDYAGHPVVRTDALGNETLYTYNGFGELASITRPNGFKKAFERNRHGAIDEMSYSDGRAFTMELDKFDRPLSMRENGALSQVYTYYRSGLLSSATDYNLGNDDVDEVFVSRKWDTLGNLIEDHIEGDGIGEPGTFKANYANNRIEGIENDVVPYPENLLRVRWRNTAPSMPYWMHNSDWGKVGWFSARGGKIQQRNVYTDPLLVSVTKGADGSWGYNGFGELEEERTYSYSGNKTKWQHYEYAYNENGRLVSETENYNKSFDRDISYLLDDLDRVAEFSAAHGSQHYNLDEANNIRQSYDPSYSSHGYNFTVSNNGMNQVLAKSPWTGGTAHDYTYDQAGRMTEDYAEGPTDALTWDAQDRLVHVYNGYLPTYVDARYGYDALNRRVYKESVERDESNHQIRESVRYHLLGDDVMVEEHSETNLSTNETKDWLLNIFHQPGTVDRYMMWSLWEDDGSGYERTNRFAPLYDPRNNVIAVVNDDDELAAEVAYDLYGKIAAAKVDGHTANLNQRTDRHRLAQVMPYGFSGRRHDAESELMYYRTRYYSPEIGRFISVDSIGIWGDLNNYGNGYGYVGNMANFLVDPFGDSGAAWGLWAVGAAGLILSAAVAASAAVASVVTCGAFAPLAIGTASVVTGAIMNYVDDYEDNINAEKLAESEKARNKAEAALAKEEKARKKAEAESKKKDKKIEELEKKLEEQEQKNKKDNEENKKKNKKQQKGSGNKRPNPSDDDGTSAAEILINGWFHKLPKKESSPNILEDLDDMGGPSGSDYVDPDDVLSGTIGNMFRSRPRVGLDRPTGEVPPIRILEDGTVILDRRGMKGGAMGFQPSQWDTVMQLLFKVDPNLGGAVDPAPIEAAHIPYAYEPAPIQ